MNKIIKTLLVVMALAMVVMAFVACDQETEVDPCANGHTMEAIAEKVATCTEDGYSAGVVCSVCGYAERQSFVLEAKGHKLVDVAAQAPTCTEAGYTAHKVCGRDDCDYIEGKEVVPATGHIAGEDGVCTGGCGQTVVTTGDELIAALAAGKNVVLMNDIEMDATLKCPYGNAVGVAQKGGVLDGNGHTLTVNGSGNYYAIITYGGTIKNLTINSGFRAIVLYTPTEDVIIDNVTIYGDNIVYGLNTAEYPTLEGIDIVVKNSTICGWISYAGPYASVTFENCEFIQGVAYDNAIGRLVRPYVSTTFTNCSFIKNAYLDLSALEEGETVTLVGCTVDGVDVTVDVFTTEEDHGEIPFTYEAPATGVALYAVEGGVSFHRNGLAVGEDNKIVITDALDNGYGYYITWVYFVADEAAKYTFAGEGLTIWVYDTAEVTLTTVPVCYYTGTANLEAGKTYYVCLAVTAAGETGEFVATVTKHVHAYEAVVTNPTCTEKGYTTYTCACGATYTGNEVAALGHTAGAEATCTTAQTCTACGTELAAATGHAYADGVCGNCGAEDPNYYPPVSIPEALELADNKKIEVTGTVIKINTPYDSTYKNITVTIADENGVQLYVYRLKGNVEVGQIITIKGVMGTYSGARQVAAGATFTAIGTHTCENYTDATCEKLSACVVCGTTRGELAEHNYVDGACANCGATQGVSYNTVSKTHTEIAKIAGVTAGQNTGVISGKEIKLDDNISIVCAKGGASSDPCIYSESIRLYQNGATLTIKGEGMTKIVITLANNSAGDGPIAVTGGTADNASAPTNYVYTITVDEGVSQVVITTKGTDKNSRLYVAGIEVTYAE